MRLPNGDFVEVERRVRRVLALLANAAEAPKRGRRAELRIPEAALGTLRSLRDAGYEFEPEASGADWLSQCDRILATDPPLPPGLTATLRPYQLEGFRWLWRFSQLGLGVCLADDMGLGKTLEAIALLLTRRAGGPALVVAPTSVCSNWIDELRRFAPGLTVLDYAGKGRAALLEQFRAAPGPDVLDRQLRAPPARRERALVPDVEHGRARRRAVHQERAIARAHAPRSRSPRATASP